MKVGEIMERLSKGESLKDIIGKDPTSVRRKLTAMGYEWDNSAKVWEWRGAGDEPLDINIFEGGRRQQMKSNSEIRELKENDHKPISEHEKKSISPDVHSSFTKEEMELIRLLLREWKAQRETTGVQVGLAPSELYERVRQLEPIPVEQKQRKTIVIDPKVGERFDQFTDKLKLNKGDLISLALSDFIDRYDV